MIGERQDYWLSLAEAAELVGIGRSTLLRDVQAGMIQDVRKQPGPYGKYEIPRHALHFYRKVYVGQHFTVNSTRYRVATLLPGGGFRAEPVGSNTSNEREDKAWAL